MNRLITKVSKCNLHPLKVLGRYCDLELQVGENIPVCLIIGKRFAINQTGKLQQLTLCVNKRTSYDDTRVIGV